MKIQELKGFPEKREVVGTKNGTATKAEACIAWGDVGFNQAREVIGSMSVGLDVEKIRQLIMVECKINPQYQDQWIKYAGREYNIAVAIADNIKSILVVKGEMCTKCARDEQIEDDLTRDYKESQGIG